MPINGRISFRKQVTSHLASMFFLIRLVGCVVHFVYVF